MFAKLRHKKELYRYLNDRIKSDTQVMPYIKSLKEYSSVYAALQNPDHSFWKEYGNGKYLKCTEDLRVLRLFNIKTPLSLLMAAYRKYDVDNFTTLIRLLAVVSVRYLDNFTLEHVLPYNPTDEWQEYFGIDTCHDAIDRLANFALLPARKNRRADRDDFAEKKPC